MGWLSTVAGWIGGSVFPMVAIAGFAALAGVAIYAINTMIDGAYNRGLTQARAECVAERSKESAAAEERIRASLDRHTEISARAHARANAATEEANRMRTELAASRAAHKAVLEGECVPGCRVVLPE